MFLQRRVSTRVSHLQFILSVRIFLVSLYDFYCFTILLAMLLTFVWWNSWYWFELSVGLLHLCSCMTRLCDVVWVCHYFSVLSNKTSECTFITSPQWP